MMNFKDQNFGIEIETSGVTRENMAYIIGNYFGTSDSVTYVGGSYDTYKVKDQNGRWWKCMYDSSILAPTSAQKCEIVSPILQYEDIPDLQAIVRKAREAGAKSSSKKRCGIHVHVDAANHDIQSLKNLVNLVCSYQDIIYKALNVDPFREEYCKKLESVLVDRWNVKGLNTMEKGETAWYGPGGEYGKYEHYNNTRYHGLNLHSVFSKGTVEFRLFNGTLHAGKVKAYVVLCLALSAFSINKKWIKRKHSNKFNEKYLMYALLCNIGIKGEEFSVIRKHLTDKLDGSLTHDGRYTA